MKINQKQKELIKIYIGLFILIFVLINWNDVSWIFNYREISGLAYDFFHPYQESDLLVSATTNATVPSTTVTTNTNNQLQEIPSFPYTQKSNSLEIPTIGLETALVIGQTTDVAQVEKELDKGVVYYPGSVAPGKPGSIAILGHSAPPNWPKIKHDWVFSNIEKLQAGDQVILYFNNHQYTYVVTEKNIIQRGQEISPNGLDGKTNILTLISCWPPGKDYQRIAVSAKLVTSK